MNARQSHMQHTEQGQMMHTHPSAEFHPKRVRPQCYETYHLLLMPVGVLATLAFQTLERKHTPWQSAFAQQGPGHRGSW